MECIAAGLGNDVGRGAKAAAEFGVGVVSKNAEFRDGIHWRFENESSIHSVEVVRAIDQEIVRLRTLPVNPIRLSLMDGRACLLQPRRQWHHARL